MRKLTSGSLAVCFYILFFLFAWYVAYQMALEFYTGENVGMPGNPKIIPQEALKPAMDFVVRRILLISLYACVFGNWLVQRRPRRREERTLSEKRKGIGKWLKAVFFPRRSHVWTIPWWIQAVILTAFSWHIRMEVIEWIGQDTVQILDFERVFEMSLKEGSIVAEVSGVNFYRAFPNWALYVKLIHCLNAHFGMVPLTGILWNVVASCASVTMVYLIIYLASGRDVLAIISALLFSLNPFYLYYEILLSPDFTFILLCLTALLILTAAWRLTKDWRLRMAAALPFGAALSLSSFFKSIDKILIIALVIVFFLRLLARGRLTKQKIIRGLCTALVFAVSYSAVINLGYAYIDDYVSGESNRDVSPYFLSVGLDAKHGGQWSQETLDLYLGLIRDYDYDFDRVNEEMKTHVKKVVKEQNRLASSQKEPGLWRDFMEYKLRKAWGNNEGLRFVMNTINEKNPLTGLAFYEDRLPEVQAFTVATGLLMALGAVGAIFRREKGAVMVSALMVYGFALLLLLSEVQPRYKTVVYPFMAAVSAYGIESLLFPVRLAVVGGLRRLRKKEANEG